MATCGATLKLRAEDGGIVVACERERRHLNNHRATIGDEVVLWSQHQSDDADIAACYAGTPEALPDAESD